MLTHKSRIDRLTQLEALIPRHAPDDDCPDASRLLTQMRTHYANKASPDARRRAIQRDLADLVDEDRIEPVNPGGKPLRYRRLREDAETDDHLWAYARTQIEDILKAELPAGQLDAVWQRMLENGSGTGLDTSKLRILSDSQRLLPADIGEGVLANVLQALALTRTLKIGYRDTAGKRTTPTIHPQAVLQRGPRVYLFAMKDNESLVRMYALHRITSSELCKDPARQADDFDLDDHIRRGNADFGDGKQIKIVLRVRGYVASLLEDCRLSADQRIEDEEEGSNFERRVTATVPATGQLLRWLLGCGDKVQLIEPAELRTVMAEQTAKAAGLYKAD